MKIQLFRSDYNKDENKPLTHSEIPNPASEGDAAACSTVVLDFD